MPPGTKAVQNPIRFYCRRRLESGNKLEKIVMLQELKREGLSISAIARRTGLDQKTVRKLLDRGLPGPVRTLAVPGDQGARLRRRLHGRDRPSPCNPAGRGA